MAPPPDLEAIGREVRAAREALGLSQATLAEEVETHQATISLIERGLLPHAAHWHLPRIYQQLGLPESPALEWAS